MQFIKQSAARLGLAATLAMGLAFGLAACGGGSGEDEPEFAITAAVQGGSAPDTTLAAGQSATIDVPSGATLVFASAGETRWTPTPSSATFTVNNFSYTSKSMTVTSHEGGSLTVVFTDRDDSTKTATLSVNVAPEEFSQVSRVDGEVEAWTITYQSSGGTSENKSLRRTVLLGADGYGLEFGDPETGTYAQRNLYDTQDRYLGYTLQAIGLSCLYDAPVAQVSYPLHVGKTWSGSATRHCLPERDVLAQEYVRTVEAYERITVPQGTHDVLRIKANLRYAVSFPTVPDAEPFSYTLESTCWWAVDLGRSVKCTYERRFDDGTTTLTTETLTGLTR
ncbi:MAG: hypothetical protein ACOZJX_18530 [Pseudomonadota bacterium]